jgi:GH35 family endo-1,4-beta-xylanase
MELRWSGAALALTPKDALAWEKAEQESAAHRCGEVFIRVVDDDGRPLRGVPVQFRQVRHAFRFGLHYPYDAAVYDLAQSAGCNAATLWLGWKHVQPEPGVFNWDYLERVWNPAALHQRGLRLTAHALNWFKPRWQVLPSYLLETPLARLPQLVYLHVEQLAQRWSSYLDTFELINEPFWSEANALPLTLEDMVLICRAAALAVRDVAPQARLEVNLTEVARTASYQVRPLDFLEALDLKGVPWDSLGLQTLENSYSATTPPTFFRTKTFTGIHQALRQLVGPGRPLHISALAVPSVPPPARPPTHFKLPYGPWDEDAQARYLDAAYTFLFAQPEVEGITWWCAVDGRLAYIAGGGLLRADLSPKPAYHALQQWIQRHTSSGSTATDDEGKAVVRGFAGDYDVSVGTGAQGRRVVYTILARTAHDHTVVLERD